MPLSGEVGKSIMTYLHMIDSLHRILFSLCKPPFPPSLLVSSCSAYCNILMEGISDLPD